MNYVYGVLITNKLSSLSFIVALLVDNVKVIESVSSFNRLVDKYILVSL